MHETNETWSAASGSEDWSEAMEAAEASHLSVCVVPKGTSRFVHGYILFWN